MKLLIKQFSPVRFLHPTSSAQISSPAPYCQATSTYVFPLREGLYLLPTQNYRKKYIYAIFNLRTETWIILQSDELQFVLSANIRTMESRVIRWTCIRHTLAD